MCCSFPSHAQSDTVGKQAVFSQGGQGPQGDFGQESQIAAEGPHLAPGCNFHAWLTLIGAEEVMAKRDGGGSRPWLGAMLSPPVGVP